VGLGNSLAWYVYSGMVKREKGSVGLGGVVGRRQLGRPSGKILSWEAPDIKIRVGVGYLVM